MTGSVVSMTVTSKLASSELLPESSVAEQETVVAPSGKVVPDAGSHMTVGLASTMSVAVGAV